MCKNANILDPDTKTGEFQRKMEILNGIMTSDRQNRQAQYLGNCKCIKFQLKFMSTGKVKITNTNINSRTKIIIIF